MYNLMNGKRRLLRPKQVWNSQTMAPLYVKPPQSSTTNPSGGTKTQVRVFVYLIHKYRCCQPKNQVLPLGLLSQEFAKGVPWHANRKKHHCHPTTPPRNRRTLGPQTLQRRTTIEEVSGSKRIEDRSFEGWRNQAQ